MIPVVDALCVQQRDAQGRLMWKRTLADEMLAPYADDLGFFAAGKWFPLYAYIEAYERIKDREGRIVPFELNFAQITIYKQMCEMKREEGNIRENLGKSRQVGCSTLTSGMFWPLTAFQPGKDCGIVADTEEHGQNLLDKYKLFFETTPDFLKRHLKVSVDNASTLSFDYGNGIKSTIEVNTAGPKSGRSKHYNYLHESECATWVDPAATIGALDATVSDTDPSSIIIRETTAQGINYWKTLFEQGQARRGTFRSIFVPWYDEPSYKARWREHELNEFEIKLRDEHHCSKEQIQWWRNKWENFGCEFTTMGREYPTTPSEMFLATGFGYFDVQLVAKRKDELSSVRGREVMFSCTRSSSVDGYDITYSNLSANDAKNAGTTIYEEPIAGHPYVLSLDPCAGGEDYWAAVVVDNSDCRQVAVYHKQGSKVSYDEAIAQIYCLYRYYETMGGFLDPINRVGFTFENNTPLGIGEDMSHAGIKAIYIDHSQNTMSDRYLDKWGWRTDVNNRDNMLKSFREGFRANYRIVNDFETVSEMETFQWQKSGITASQKAQALRGKHDDLVMAYAGFYYCRHDFPATIVKVAGKRSKKLPFNPLAKRDREDGDEFQTFY